LQHQKEVKQPSWPLPFFYLIFKLFVSAQKANNFKSLIKLSILDSESFKVWFQILTRWEDQREKSNLS
jgi:hypothetical protein